MKYQVCCRKLHCTSQRSAASVTFVPQILNTYIDFHKLTYVSLLFKISRLSASVLVAALIQPVFAQEKVLDIGEELKYEVSFGFIKLGYIKYNLTSTHKEGKRIVYNARLEVKTYPEVPFVKLNDIFETEMEDSDEKLFTDQYYETNFREKSISRTDCRFDYKKKQIKLKKEIDGRQEEDRSFVFKDEDTRFRDEVSWQYDARRNSFASKNFIVPIFKDGTESSVRYSFNFNKTLVKIEKFDYDISVIKMEGTSDYTGFFGLKGEFLVMLSDDDQRVPIKAYFNSALGNVALELISYKKDKWKPPAFLK